MLKTIRHYFTALVILLICAAGYHAAATVYLQPPKVAMVESRTPTDLPDLNQKLVDLFEPGAWQLADCTRLMTSNGVLLFKNLEQTATDQWRLKPVTLVIGRGTADGVQSDPIVLTAQDGAEVQFAESLELIGGGGAPPIKRGRMIGKVKITRASKKRPKQTLHIETSNVGIDNQKVWTTDEFRMHDALPI